MTTSTLSLPARLIAATAAGLLSVGLLAGCSDDEPAPAPSASASAGSDAAADEHMAENITEFSYAGQDGETALDLLLVQDPEAQTTGEGEMAFVTTIKGRTAEDGKEFWGLYVDGEMAEVGAGSLVTEDGQQIQWKLEAIDQ
ncbi:DUF4430 domain-containing protein [Isoptericola jiangsuensis]|uniref:DUF4430 domain-containing protein n=1 Tax=Isoptericola jiangsuensis TaxID=548579 RepID=UPI003AAB6145